MLDDEMLDVVNGHDEVIGTVNRKDYKQFVQANEGFIRASELLIVNDEGKVWVPIRTAHKTIAPNGYDYSVSGHVAAGESYIAALIRETKEEVNLDITPDQVVFLAKLKSVSIKYIRSVYVLHTNTAPTFNTADFKSAEWLSPDELLNRIEAGHPAKSDLRSAIVVLQLYLSGE